MSKSRDFTSSIERLELMEERLGVQLDALSAFIDEDGDIEIFGEIRSAESSELEDNLAVVAAAYDMNGRVVGSDTYWIRADNFVGLEVFSIVVHTRLPPSVKLRSVRVYPKKM